MLIYKPFFEFDSLFSLFSPIPTQQNKSDTDTNISKQYQLYGTICIGEIFANPAATNNCPPYGINPLKAHEKVPSRLRSEELKFQTDHRCLWQGGPP